MSDWRAFMESQLAVAFGSALSDEATYWSVRFFEDRHSSPVDTITPRSVNKFVNYLVSTRLRSPDEEVDLASIAFYCANAVQIRDNLLGFLSADLARVPPLDNWRASVVAIHHSVPVRKAMQVLLHDPLIIIAPALGPAIPGSGCRNWAHSGPTTARSTIPASEPAKACGPLQPPPSAPPA